MKDDEKSNYEVKENELPQCDQVVASKEVETVAVMDMLLYKAAFGGYKNLPIAIAGDHDDEDDNDLDDEWKILNVNEEYFMRKTECKNNFLHLCVQFQNFTLAEKVAKRFPKLISEVNDNDNNSLHVASQIGNADLVKKIIVLYQQIFKDKKSPPWEKKNKEGNTPLHVAIIYGNIELACYFVNLQPTLAGIYNNSDEAPLHLTIRHRVDNDEKLVEDVFKSITNRSIALDKKESTYSKTEKNSMPLLNLLLRKDPSIVCKRDKKGLTPLLLAATLNPSYVQAISAMVNKWPGSSEVCDELGNTILHLMTKFSFEDDEKGQVAVKLLNSPPSVLKNKQNNDGNTLAHIAIMSQNIDLTAALIIFSANLAIKNKEGVSAAALIQQSSDKFRTLMKYKTMKMAFQVNLRTKFEGRVKDDEIREIGFSMERLKESKILHCKTSKGNILHALMYQCPDHMEDNEVKVFIKQILKMVPILICHTNNLDETALHLLAQKGPCLIDEEIRKMIEHSYERVTQEEGVEGFFFRPPWIIKDTHGNTILHRALSHNWPAASWLEQILKFDSSLAHQVNKKGELPLHVLVKTVCSPDHKRKKGNMVNSGLSYNLAESLDMLHFGGKFINRTDKDGLTPFLTAARAMDIECTNLLLDKHLCPEKNGSRNCDLKLVYQGDPDGNTFWHHIANIQVPDDDITIETVWMRACSHVYYALKEINNNGKTAFHLAIENDNFKVANMFSKTLRGDESRWKSSHLAGNGDGNVPLHLVAGRSNLSFARQFIECVTRSMELIRAHNKMGLTPIHLAVLKNDIQFLEIIFDLNRDDKEMTQQILQITDKNDNTPLHYAISQGAVEFVDMFYKEGIRAENIDEILVMSDKDGNAPLHLAVLKGNSSLATKFIDRAKENNFIERMLDKHNIEGNTALHLTVSKSNLEIANTLIKTAKENNYTEVVLDKRNNDGNTPMHFAIQKKDFKLLKCFIECAIEGSCINEILGIPNNNGETPSSLIGSAEHLPSKFEKFFWNEPKVVQAMLGVRSLSGVPTKMIKEYTNTIGVIAALLATITFTAGFTVPGGLDSKNGSPLLIQSRAFQVFMVSDIIAMCLSMMVLFFLMWIMTINNEKHQVILLDLTVFSLQGAFYSTLVAFMTGLYASVFHSIHWIAIFACVLCSLLILLMHKRLIIWFIPGFVHLYVWYQKVKKLCGRIAWFSNLPTK